MCNTRLRRAHSEILTMFVFPICSKASSACCRVRWSSVLCPTDSETEPRKERRHDAEARNTQHHRSHTIIESNIAEQHNRRDRVYSQMSMRIRYAANDACWARATPALSRASLKKMSRLCSELRSRTMFSVANTIDERNLNH